MRTRRDPHGLSMDALLSVNQAAEVLNVSHQAVRDLVRRGEIASLPWGRRDIRVPRKSLTAFVDREIARFEERRAAIDNILALPKVATSRRQSQ